MDSNVANDVITEMDVFESAKVKNTTPSNESSDSEREYSWNHLEVEDKKVVATEDAKQDAKQEVKKEETKQEEVKTATSDDDMPPLVSEDESDDMSELLSDRADQIMMAIFPKPDCERCEAAMKVLMGHVGNTPESSEIELSEHSDDEDEDEDEKDTGVPTIIGGLFIIYLILQIIDLINRLSGRSSIQYCRPL